ncbi:pseudouridine synthase [Halomicronema sp. CCY15110]|uniref:RluA family pseudouridine synthase n=1 Tax=Halomicronema sp. CCY15110 TaxID=2767773 RepID=UPI00195217BA|nr:pseudouridine synthase [Halomicronema sp. CCY15110]
MGRLYPVTDFVAGDRAIPSNPPDYWYEGRCPQTHQWLRLPRTPEAEAIAQGLMPILPAAIGDPTEGKMIGVLLVATPTGERGVLKAFSGLWHGQATVAGWVPPIPGREQVSLLEIQTLRQLEQLKQEIITRQQMPERALFTAQSQIFAEQLQAWSQWHRQQKQARDRRREQDAQTLTGPELAQTESELVRQSQHEGGEKRRLKRQRDAVLAPLRAAIAQADAQIRELKQQRQALSRQLQTQMHAAYSLTNFAGETAALAALWPIGLPTGTGDCAAPKLLHYAATHDLKPLAMAEFWWGPATDDKHPGQFYGACADRCQPIMGFLLSGLTPADVPKPIADEPLPLLFEDASLLVVDKPSGLLSVPGRTQALQDSVVSRLRCQRSDIAYLAAGHRLDKGTSGLLVLAKTEVAQRHLHQQFAHRQVQKTYEALLSAPVEQPQGRIDLPLWRDPHDRPKTTVHPEYGKPSLTEYQVLTAGDRPRLHFVPHTGRTHQLRVHAAHPHGLNAPILGDTLYGTKGQTDRLHLHAKAIRFRHPVTAEDVVLTSPVPF